MSADAKSHPFAHLRKYLLAGVLTAIPVWVTWLVFDFVFRQLSRVGTPWVRAMAKAQPQLADWLLTPWVQSLLATLVTLLLLYLLGLIATLVIGRRLIALFEALVKRIPLAQKIYGSTKQLVSVLQQQPKGTRRVVLIDFPSPGMRVVAFVTRTFRDGNSGQELAAVYVPTTPNPTSGYLEILPLDRVTPTDWSVDEAMSFIISGGAIAPDTLSYTPRGAKPEMQAQPGAEEEPEVPAGNR